MMKSIGLSTFVFLLGCILCNAASVGYTVRTQEEFDAYIKKAQSGEPIEISLAKGNYVLKSKIIAGQHSPSMEMEQPLLMLMIGTLAKMQ